jgi:bacillithiol system protein YtxJ
MNWILLDQPEQVEAIRLQSAHKTQVLFKHSTRCSLSSTIKARLERAAAPPNADFYLLDLIANRQLSNQVADAFDIWHESPQVLVIRNGECIFDESHMAIQMDEIASFV